MVAIFAIRSSVLRLSASFTIWRMRLAAPIKMLRSKQSFRMLNVSLVKPLGINSSHEAWSTISSLAKLSIVISSPASSLISAPYTNKGIRIATPRSTDIRARFSLFSSSRFFFASSVLSSFSLFSHFFQSTGLLNELHSPFRSWLWLTKRYGNISAGAFISSFHPSSSVVG